MSHYMPRHLSLSPGKTACGLTFGRNPAVFRPIATTHFPSNVQCKRCQATQAFKAATTEHALLGNPSSVRE